MVTNIDTRSTNNYLLSSFEMNLFHSVDLWTKDDVEKWLKYCIEEYSLGDINLNAFQMNGKALLLLTEEGFQQRSTRSGDILYKALQQHNQLINSSNYRNFPYYLWNHYNSILSSSIRNFNIPISTMNYVNPTFNFISNNTERKNQTIFNNLRTQQMSNSTLVNKSLTKPNINCPRLNIKQENFDKNYIKIDENELESNNLNQIDESTNKQIHYYNDRINYRGDILLKPRSAKNCRILWEFLYILLEDSNYESIIRWENRLQMVFRIVHAEKLAALWGLQKNRLSMTYEKLSRGMRYYYSNNIISKEQSKRLLYRFMRSPDEIRKNMKRHCDTTNMIYSPINKRKHPRTSETNINNNISQCHSTCSSKSDLSNSTSSDPYEIEKQFSISPPPITSSKRKKPILTSHSSRIDQPLNLAISKDDKKTFNYKKQKLLYTSSIV